MFKEFIWNVYVYTSTESDALKNKDGQPATMYSIDKDNTLAILTPEDAFHVYTISDSWLGWKVTDDINIPIKKSESEKPYAIERTKLSINKSDEVDTLLVTTNDPDIRDVRAIDEHGNEHKLNAKPNNETYLNFTFDEQGFDEDLTFKFYSSEDKLLYSEE